MIGLAAFAGGKLLDGGKYLAKKAAITAATSVAENVAQRAYSCLLKDSDPNKFNRDGAVSFNRRDVLENQRKVLHWYTRGSTIETKIENKSEFAIIYADVNNSSKLLNVAMAEFEQALKEIVGKLDTNASNINSIDLAIKVVNAYEKMIFDLGEQFWGAHGLGERKQLKLSDDQLDEICIKLKDAKENPENFNKIIELLKQIIGRNDPVSEEVVGNSANPANPGLLGDQWLPKLDSTESASNAELYANRRQYIEDMLHMESSLSQLQDDSVRDKLFNYYMYGVVRLPKTKALLKDGENTAEEIKKQNNDEINHTILETVAFFDSIKSIPLRNLLLSAPLRKNPWLDTGAKGAVPKLFSIYDKYLSETQRLAMELVFRGSTEAQISAYFEGYTKRSVEGLLQVEYKKLTGSLKKDPANEVKYIRQQNKERKDVLFTLDHIRGFQNERKSSFTDNVKSMFSNGKLPKNFDSREQAVEVFGNKIALHNFHHNKAMIGATEQRTGSTSAGAKTAWQKKTMANFAGLQDLYALITLNNNGKEFEKYTKRYNDLVGLQKEHIAGLERRIATLFVQYKGMNELFKNLNFLGDLFHQFYLYDSGNTQSHQDKVENFLNDSGPTKGLNLACPHFNQLNPEDQKKQKEFLRLILNDGEIGKILKWHNDESSEKQKIQIGNELNSPIYKDNNVPGQFIINVNNSIYVLKPVASTQMTQSECTEISLSSLLTDYYLHKIDTPRDSSNLTDKTKMTQFDLLLVASQLSAQVGIDDLKSSLRKLNDANIKLSEGNEKINSRQKDLERAIKALSTGQDPELGIPRVISTLLKQIKDGCYQDRNTLELSHIFSKIDWKDKEERKSIILTIACSVLNHIGFGENGVDLNALADASGMQKLDNLVNAINEYVRATMELDQNIKTHLRTLATEIENYTKTNIRYTSLIENTKAVALEKPELLTTVLEHAKENIRFLEKQTEKPKTIKERLLAMFNKEANSKVVRQLAPTIYYASAAEDFSRAYASANQENRRNIARLAGNISQIAANSSRSNNLSRVDESKITEMMTEKFAELQTNYEAISREEVTEKDVIDGLNLLGEVKKEIKMHPVVDLSAYKDSPIDVYGVSFGDSATSGGKKFINLSNNTSSANDSQKQESVQAEAVLANQCRKPKPGIYPLKLNEQSIVYMQITSYNDNGQLLTEKTTTPPPVAPAPEGAPLATPESNQTDNNKTYSEWLQRFDGLLFPLSDNEISELVKNLSGTLKNLGLTLGVFGLDAAVAHFNEIKKLIIEISNTAFAEINNKLKEAVTRDQNKLTDRLKQTSDEIIGGYKAENARINNEINVLDQKKVQLISLLKEMNATEDIISENEAVKSLENQMAALTLKLKQNDNEIVKIKQLYSADNLALLVQSAIVKACFHILTDYLHKPEELATLLNDQNKLKEIISPLLNKDFSTIDAVTSWLKSVFSHDIYGLRNEVDSMSLDVFSDALKSTTKKQKEQKKEHKNKLCEELPDVNGFEKTTIKYGDIKVPVYRNKDKNNHGYYQIAGDFKYEVKAPDVQEMSSNPTKGKSRQQNYRLLSKATLDALADAEKQILKQCGKLAHKKIKDLNTSISGYDFSIKALEELATSMDTSSGSAGGNDLTKSGTDTATSSVNTLKEEIHETKLRLEQRIKSASASVGNILKFDWKDSGNKISITYDSKTHIPENINSAKLLEVINSVKTGIEQCAKEVTTKIEDKKKELSEIKRKPLSSEQNQLLIDMDYLIADNTVEVSIINAGSNPPEFRSDRISDSYISFGKDGTYTQIYRIRNVDNNSNQEFTTHTIPLNLCAGKTCSAKALSEEESLAIFENFCPLSMSKLHNVAVKKIEAGDLDHHDVSAEDAAAFIFSQLFSSAFSNFNSSQEVRFPEVSTAIFTVKTPNLTVTFNQRLAIYNGLAKNLNHFSRLKVDEEKLGKLFEECKRDVLQQFDPAKKGRLLPRQLASQILGIVGKQVGELRDSVTGNNSGNRAGMIWRAGEILKEGQFVTTETSDPNAQEESILTNLASASHSLALQSGGYFPLPVRELSQTVSGNIALEESLNILTDDSIQTERASKISDILDKVKRNQNVSVGASSVSQAGSTFGGELNKRLQTGSNNSNLEVTDLLLKYPATLGRDMQLLGQVFDFTDSGTILDKNPALALEYQNYLTANFNAYGVAFFALYSLKDGVSHSATYLQYQKGLPNLNEITSTAWSEAAKQYQTRVGLVKILHMIFGGIISLKEIDMLVEKGKTVDFTFAMDSFARVMGWMVAKIPSAQLSNASGGKSTNQSTASRTEYKAIDFHQAFERKIQEFAEKNNDVQIFNEQRVAYFLLQLGFYGYSLRFKLQGNIPPENDNLAKMALTNGYNVNLVNAINIVLGVSSFKKLGEDSEAEWFKHLALLVDLRRILEFSLVNLPPYSSNQETSGQSHSVQPPAYASDPVLKVKPDDKDTSKIGWSSNTTKSRKNLDQSNPRIGANRIVSLTGTGEQASGNGDSSLKLPTSNKKRGGGGDNSSLQFDIDLGGQ